LDPAKANANGQFSDQYLRQVYTSPVFKDAWELCKYLNEKGIEPIFNISGAVPALWTTTGNIRKDPLANFEAYGQMAASLLHWARNNEGIRFSKFMPFNETDMGYPEGPKITNKDIPKAIEAVHKHLIAVGLGNLDYILMDDTGVNLERIEQLIKSPFPKQQLAAVGVHTYGNGLAEDGRSGWLEENSPFKNALQYLKKSAVPNPNLWLTEYGDLDQTGQIEHEVAWRSTRRLLKTLNDGLNAAIAWDAFDNYHVHDSTYAYYGLFRTDTTIFRYWPKPRYFAAKQVYKYVKPGFRQVAFTPAAPADPAYVYNEWVRSFRNILVSAFVSPTDEDLTVVGMNSVEGIVPIEIDLQDFPEATLAKPMNLFISNRTKNCQKVAINKAKNGKITFRVPEHSIFTLTTLP
jgi:hypothetical protein